MMTPAVTWQSNPPEKLLKERFHISTGFHPGQRDIIEQLIQAKRLLVIQRTGWGKSLCYQMASLYYPYLTLVFSPLKALMRDQCQRCNDVYNIPAAIVSSEFSQEENKTTLVQAVDGNFKILLIAPERLDNADWQNSNFPLIRLSERMLNAAKRFLEEEYLPRIEKRGTEKRPIHEAGWSLSYHGTTRTGKLVRASKYEDAGPFAQSLVVRAVDVVRTRYPLEAMNGIVSVPPTRSGMLVENFARQIAGILGLEYLSILTKVRQTREQKSLSNWLQKADNVKDAFVVHFPEQVAGRTLLLIDDIYDSGVRRFGAHEIPPKGGEGESNDL
jgi:DEAD/DEAH box helicase